MDRRASFTGWFDVSEFKHVRWLSSMEVIEINANNFELYALLDH